MLTLEHRPPTEAEIERLRAEWLGPRPTGRDPGLGCAVAFWGLAGAMAGAFIAVIVAVLDSPDDFWSLPWVWPAAIALAAVGAISGAWLRLRVETGQVTRWERRAAEARDPNYDLGEVTVIRGEPEGAVVLPAYEDEGDTWFLGAGSGQILALFGQFADDLDEDTFPASRFSLSLLGPHLVLDYQPDGPLLEGITILDPERLKSEVYEAIGQIDIVLYPGRLETCVADLVSHLADPHL